MCMHVCICVDCVHVYLLNGFELIMITLMSKFSTFTRFQKYTFDLCMSAVPFTRAQHLLATYIESVNSV